MTLPLTATDADGHTMTVVWAHEETTVHVRIEAPRVGLPEGYWADVQLEPDDARAMARQLLDAAIAAEQARRMR